MENNKYIQQAIILAGGFGTRLKSVVSEVPKPMAPIGNKPFLEIVLEQCLKYNIQKVALAVGYKHETITDYFGNNYRGIELIYSIEEEPLGTGGAIAQAAVLLEDKPFVVLNGDTLFKTNLYHLSSFYSEKKADMAIALCCMEDFDRYGVVEIDQNGRVLDFKEKQYQKTGNINAGVYILTKAILDKSNLPLKFSFEKDFMEAFVQDYLFYGMPSTDYFIDIGIPEDYTRAQNDLK